LNSSLQIDVDLQAIQDPQKKVKFEVMQPFALINCDFLTVIPHQALVVLHKAQPLHPAQARSVLPILRRLLKVESDNDVKVSTFSLIVSFPLT
jgi:hypothetical protein